MVAEEDGRAGVSLADINLEQEIAEGTERKRRLSGRSEEPVVWPVD